MRKINKIFCVGHVPPESNPNRDPEEVPGPHPSQQGKQLLCWAGFTHLRRGKRCLHRCPSGGSGRPGCSSGASTRPSGGAAAAWWEEATKKGLHGRRQSPETVTSGKRSRATGTCLTEGQLTDDSSADQAKDRVWGRSSHAYFKAGDECRLSVPWKSWFTLLGGHGEKAMLPNPDAKGANSTFLFCAVRHSLHPSGNARPMSSMNATRTTCQACPGNTKLAQCLMAAHHGQGIGAALVRCPCATGVLVRQCQDRLRT